MTIIPGTRIRVYHTDFTKQGPDDHIPGTYNEGVVSRTEPYFYQKPIPLRLWYTIDKVVAGGECFPRSWKVGCETEILSDCSAMKIISDQLEIPVRGKSIWK